MTRVTPIALERGCYARFHFVGKLRNLGLADYSIYGKQTLDKEEKIDLVRSAFIMFNGFPDNSLDQKLTNRVPLI